MFKANLICVETKFTLLLCVFVIIVAEIDGCFAKTRQSKQTEDAGEVQRIARAKKIDENLNIQCRDENDNAVPWFIAYKLPKIKAGPTPAFKKGLGYSFILPGSSKWMQSDKAIGDSSSLIGETLKPFFQNLDTQEILSLVYNDQPAYRNDIGYNGHTKGVILAGLSNGIWLIHSVPKFPSVPSSTRSGYYNFYPTNGLTNAQMFLCLSLSSTQIDNIGNIFKFTRPHVNNVTLPERLKSAYPTLTTFLAKKRFSNRGPTAQIFNVTVDDLEFQIFAKSPKLDQEIYSEWLAPTLKSSLDVQSWLNGINAYTSNCTRAYPVYNIRDKKVDGKDFSRNDHSKWAVGRESSDPWTCISDLNRMEGQKSRGGAALCLYNSKIWTAFNSAVIDLQPCPIPIRGY